MAAPPIPVTSPGGPDTPEGPIILPANCAVVASTFVILDWQPAAAAPGGGAQVQLPTFAAVKAFLPFCRLSRNPADIAAAGADSTIDSSDDAVAHGAVCAIRRALGKPSGWLL